MDQLKKFIDSICIAHSVTTGNKKQHYTTIIKQDKLFIMSNDENFMSLDILPNGKIKTDIYAKSDDFKGTTYAFNFNFSSIEECTDFLINFIVNGGKEE